MKNVNGEHLFALESNKNRFCRSTEKLSILGDNFCMLNCLLYGTLFTMFVYLSETGYKIEHIICTFYDPDGRDVPLFEIIPETTEEKDALLEMIKSNPKNDKVFFDEGSLS